MSITIGRIGAIASSAKKIIITAGSISTSLTNTLNFSGYTIINGYGAANASGKINNVQIYTDEGITNAIVAIFYSIGTNTFASRDYQAIGSIAASGSIRSFTVDLDVRTGDYIGIYGADPSRIKRSTNTGYSHWVTSGNQTAASSALFSTYISNMEIPIYGIGTT